MKTVLLTDVSPHHLFRSEEWVEIFRRLRRDCPVSFCPESAYGAYWSITRLQDVRTVEADWKTFSSAGNIIIGDVPASFDLPAFATFDPPRHKSERKAVSPAAGRERASSLEPEVRGFISDLLDTLPIGEPFDWCQRVSGEITSRMAALLFGLPADGRSRLTSWCERITASPVTKRDKIEQLEAREDFLRTLNELWYSGDSHSERQDIIACLRSDPKTNEMIRHPKRLLGISTLIAGANEAAQGAIAGGVVGFSRFPEEWEKLRSRPDLLGKAVAEMVRWQSPVLHMRRTTTRDVTVNGVDIPQGAKVILWYCSANRDEAFFDDADAFQIDRPNVNLHAGFGFGIHRCFGRQIALAELKILWQGILARFSRIEVVGQPKRLASNFSGNYTELVVRLRRL